jgi:integrase
MGRKPTKNTNLPPRMRARVQKSGRTFYYYDVGGKPRKEIPLGSDYVLAVQEWARLEHPGDKVPKVGTFGMLVTRYMAEELPKLAASTQKVHRNDVKNLLRFFDDPPAPIEKIRPLHIRQFLDWMKAHPTTAARCKRLFSRLWNCARAWGWTDLENPASGIQAKGSKKRTVYITDEVYNAVYSAASEPLMDAMDLAYLTGQRPGDVLKMTERDIKDGVLEVEQGKTGARLRIALTGTLAQVIERIRKRKAGHKVWVAALCIGEHGRPLTAAVLRNHFTAARILAREQHPDLAEEIQAFWFYDLRAKAADDVADESGRGAATELLGHTDGRVTARHYLRRGTKVDPTR